MPRGPATFRGPAGPGRAPSQLNNGGQKIFISFLFLCVWSAQYCSLSLDLFLTERFFLLIIIMNRFFIHVKCACHFGVNEL